MFEEGDPNFSILASKIIRSGDGKIPEMIRSLDGLTDRLSFLLQLNHMGRFYVILLLLITVGHAQVKVDSLQQVLQTNISDTQRINTLLLLADNLKFDFPREAIGHAKEALVLAQGIHAGELTVKALLKKGDIYLKEAAYDSSARVFATALDLSKSLGRTDLEGKVLFNKAVQYYDQGEETKALKYAVEALAKLDSLKDAIAFANTLNMLGSVHTDLGNMSEALAYATRALSIVEQRGYRYQSLFMLNSLGIIHYKQSQYKQALAYFERAATIQLEYDKKSLYAKSMSNIGVIHVYLKDYENAEKRFLESLNMYLALDLENGIEGAYNKLGNLYFHQQKIDQARTYYLKALPIARKLGKAKREAGILSNIGLTLDSETEAAEKIDYFEQALAISQQHGYKSTEVTTLSNLASMYARQGDYEEALRLAKQGLALSQELKDVRQQSLFSELLGKINEELGNYQQALEYHKSYKQLSDSLFNEQNIRELTQTEMRYEFRREQLADSLVYAQQALALELEIERQRSQRNTFITAALIALLLGGFFAWNYRQKQRTNRTLTHKNTLIQATLAERETLLKEIHHRVKNNLQVVSSLLSLQSRNLQDEAAQQALKEGQNRVHAMALIHRNLYQEAHLVEVDLHTYFEELAQTLVDSYKVGAKQIVLLVEVAPIRLDVDTLIPLGLVVNELITNTLKYAFPHQSNGTLSLKIAPIDEQLMVEVADDGAGLPADFDLNTAQSMGFKLVRAFVKKMNGQISIESQEGTRIRLRIPHASTI